MQRRICCRNTADALIFLTDELTAKPDIRLCAGGKVDCGYPFVPREQKEGECIMAKSEQVIKDLDRVIGLINTDMKDIPAEEKKQMVADTIDHFDNYVSQAA